MPSTLSTLSPDQLLARMEHDLSNGSTGVVAAYRDAVGHPHWTRPARDRLHRRRHWLVWHVAQLQWNASTEALAMGYNTNCVAWLEPFAADDGDDICGHAYTGLDIEVW